VAFCSRGKPFVRPTLAQYDLGLIDQERVSHLWHKGLRKAGDGPDEFRELRYRVIRHNPSPIYLMPARGQQGGYIQ
jgi:hypothetical protein